MAQSKKSVEDRLKLKLTKQFNDNDFKLVKDLFKKLQDNESSDLRLGTIGYSHALYSLYGHHYSERILRDNVDDLNKYFFDPGKYGSYKYKQYLTTEFRPGYHFNFCMVLGFRTGLEKIKKDFDKLFFKSKLSNRFILQSRVTNDFIEIQLIRMCKPFMFKIDNPLLINMKKSIETIDGALDILKQMKNGDTVKVGGLFRYEINPDSLSDDDIIKRINKLNTERQNLSQRIYNMEK